MGARTLAVATLAIGALWSVIGQAGTTVPQLLTEQGRLTDSKDVPITVSTKLAFNIYTVATGGVSKWTESQTVTPDAGYFSVELGSVKAFPAKLFTGAELYLGVTVGTDPEMTPRQAITSVPYALIAENAIGDITPNSVTSTGAVSGTTITGSGAISGASVTASGAVSGGSLTTSGTATVTGVLAANGGVSVGGTTVINSSGQWVGTPPVPSPFVGTAYDSSNTIPSSSYGGSVNDEPGSFTPSFNGTCLLTMSYYLTKYYYGSTPGTGDYSYGYVEVNGGLIGNACYTPYPAGSTTGGWGSCTAVATVSVSSGTTYSVGCYAYGSAGYNADGVACSVGWVCVPS